MLLYHLPLRRWDDEVSYSFQTEKKLNFKSALRVMVYKNRWFNSRQPEKPTVLISRLLLRMLSTYIASIRLDLLFYRA